MSLYKKVCDTVIKHKHLKQLPKGNGYVYALKAGDNIFYIGQTNNPFRRMYEHFCLDFTRPEEINKKKLAHVAHEYFFDNNLSFIIIHKSKKRRCLALEQKTIEEYSFNHHLTNNRYNHHKKLTCSICSNFELINDIKNYPEDINQIAMDISKQHNLYYHKVYPQGNIQ